MSTFLVIEDSLTIRKLVELAFRRSSVDVDVATSGSEGLAKIKATSPRVVLLDYLLPDMKGTDICAKLAAGDGPPPSVIVMSARLEEVRNLFAPFSFVIDFVSKPFKAADIVERVREALGRDGGAAASVSSVAALPVLLPSAEREAAAFALFAQLRPRLAQIPSWALELGDTPPATFYGRRILTPEVVDRLLESLLPLLQERLRKTSPVAEEFASDVVLEGRIGSLSPHEILAVAQRLQCTGEVVVGAHGEIITFLRDGEVVLATTRNPPEWLCDLDLDLSQIPADSMRTAVAEQTASGKPVLVTLAELGCLPPCDVSGLLNEQGKRVLTRMLGRLGPGTPFRVRARAALPPYVDAYGRTETCETVQRLEANDWPARRESARPSSEAPPSIVPRQVIILAPDLEGFKRPLERLLAERPGPYTVVTVDREQDVFGAILRVRPAVVIMNVTAHGIAESARTARAVRGSDELRDLRLVAVLDLPSEEDAGPLSEAGFDAVVSKPICYSDIERLLVA